MCILSGDGKRKGRTYFVNSKQVLTRLVFVGDIAQTKDNAG
jgi:hypothetical protein